MAAAFYDRHWRCKRKLCLCAGFAARAPDCSLVHVSLPTSRWLAFMTLPQAPLVPITSTSALH